MNVKGCLSNVEEFENIIIKVGDNGVISWLKDVVCIELGVDFYVFCLIIDNNFVVGMGVF